MSLAPECGLTTPALLRAARGAFAQAMRAALADVDITDLPRNGTFILAGIDADGGPRTDLPEELGVTKQAVSNAIEALVARGYVERSTDQADRRRIALELTDDGQAAVDAVWRGIRTVDDELSSRVGRAQVDAMRAGLSALAQIKSERKASGTGRVGRRRQLLRCFPMFGVRDVRAASAHYRALGFTVVPDDEGDAHAFARREGGGLHLVVDDHTDRNGGVAYLHVRDADALYAEWQAADAAGEMRPVATTNYGMREGTHVDPDGNVIHFGSDAGT